MGLGWVGTVKGEVGCGDGQSLSGVAIQEIGSGVKSLDPVRGGNAGLEEEGAYDVVGAADNTLGSTVLWGGVGA